MLARGHAVVKAVIAYLKFGQTGDNHPPKTKNKHGEQGNAVIIRLGAGALFALHIEERTFEIVKTSKMGNELRMGPNILITNIFSLSFSAEGGSAFGGKGEGRVRYIIRNSYIRHYSPFVSLLVADGHGAARGRQILNRSDFFQRQGAEAFSHFSH